MTIGVILTSWRVEDIYLHCKLRTGEGPGVQVEGVTTLVGFHTGRLEEYKAEIMAMLDELPDEFKESIGGGASFLKACHDRHGNQWTGLHRTMEFLFMLGLAIGAVRLVSTHREDWVLLPGRMPYYVVVAHE